MLMFLSAISLIGFLTVIIPACSFYRAGAYYGYASSLCCLLPLISDNRFLTQRKIIQASIERTRVLCFDSAAGHFTICLDYMAFVNRHLYSIQRRIKIPGTAPLL